MGIMRSMHRDESMVEFLLKMLMQVLINFSMGLIMALFVSIETMCIRFLKRAPCLYVVLFSEPHLSILICLPLCFTMNINTTIHATNSPADIHIRPMENHSNIPAQSTDRPILLHHRVMRGICIRFHISVRALWRSGGRGVRHGENGRDEFED